jgi:membrane protein DedA with SNARE-associated domain
MQEWLILLVKQHPILVYGVIVLVSFVEGPILAMICGLLIKLGDIPFIPAYTALMIGDLIGDVVWYNIGYYFGPLFIGRFGKYFGITENGVATVKRIFHKYSNQILIISKITMGFGFALVTLVTAGITKIPFGRYLALNFLGQFVWTGLLLYVGYLLGNLYTYANDILSKITVLALGVIIFFSMIGYGKYVKAKIQKSV